MLQNYFQGDDIALLVTLTDPQLDLADFDVDMLICIGGYGRKLHASTHSPDRDLPISVRSATAYCVNIPASVSATLPSGDCVLETRYLHRPTDTHKTLRCKAFRLSDSKIKNYLSNE